MRKKFLTVFILLFLWVPGASAKERALFVSMIQKPYVLSDRQSILHLVQFAKTAGIKTLFIQIYRENKTWFPSKVGDSTPYNEAFKKMARDPFEMLIREAHQSGVEVHAWINLLSLAANEGAPLLQKYGPGILTRNLKEKKSLEDYKIDDQYFLEPGDPRVQKELETLVGEVISRYPELDGIQFDYIRYPDKNPAYGFTDVNMSRYRKSTNQMTIEEESPQWKKWKYEQVTGLLKLLAKKARNIRPMIKVSTTGLVPYYRANLEAFQDWRLWIKEGLVDFVTLMCYSSDLEEFKKTLRDAESKLGDLKKTNIAVGAYAFLDNPRTFFQEFQTCEDSSSRACVVFHYGNLLENPILAQPFEK